MAEKRATAAVLPGLDDGHETEFSRLARARAWVHAGLARESELRSGFLWLPVAFGLGIALYFQADREPLIWAGPLLSLLLLFGLRLSGIARGAAIGLLFVALGFSAATWRSFTVESPVLPRAGIFEIIGHVEQLDATPRRHRLLIRPIAIEGISAGQLPHALRIGVPGPAMVRPGEAVRLRARLAPPAEAAMPGGYDFRREAFFRQIGGSGFALGRVGAIEPEKITPPPFDLRFAATIDHWRNALTERIARIIGGDAGALAAALVTGKRGLIPEDTNEELRASGLYHIVSISGLHMVLAAGIFFWIARALLALSPAIALRYPIKKFAAVIAMIGATFYCLFSGSEVATERSLVMTLVMLGAILFDRPALAMRNLAISALIVLTREPEALIGPSFQMSFAAVACLIAANQVWQDRRKTGAMAERGLLHRGSTKLALAFLGILATTIVASLATAPFSAWHFHRLNPLGVIGNALAIPLVSLVVMPSAVIGTLLLPFGLDGIVWTIMGEGVRGVLYVAGKVAALDHAVVSVPRGSLPGFLLMVFALLVFTCLRTRLRLASLGVLVLAALATGSARLPDIVIDAEGRMALIRDQAGQYRLLAPGRASSFTLAQWLPSVGARSQAQDPALREGIRCDRDGCIGRLADGRIVSLATGLAALRADCQIADIIISPLAGGEACAASKARLIDRAHFARFGATRIVTPTPGAWEMVTALDPENTRPWRRKAAASDTQNPETARGAPQSGRADALATGATKDQ